MSIEKTFKVINSSGDLIKLPCGDYFCFGCDKLLKTIFHPHTGTIEPCICGSNTVYTI